MLGFDPTMVGAQNYVLSVRQGDEELAAQNFRVDRSALSYANEPGIVPGREKSVRFSLGEGSHRLRLVLGGTLAQSAGVRVERLVNEKYE